MSWRRALSKVRFLLRPRPDEVEGDDLAEEIRAHLAMEEAENIAAGMDREEARHQARRRFGNVTLAKERSRDMWKWTTLEALWMDIGYALRQLRRNPGFAAIAVLTLALGVGANTAIFSAVNAVLLRPLPFADPERLVDAQETEEAPGTYPVNPADYLDWQAQNRTLEATSVYSWTNFASLAGPGEPASAAVTQVQANFFRTLGIAPAVGRSFAKGEDVAGRNHVALLSYAFCSRNFGAATGTVGKTVELNAERYTIVGIMPPTVHFPDTTDVWVPIDMTGKQFSQRGNHGLNVIGRIKRGVTLAQARQDLLNISLRLEKQFPNDNAKQHAVLFPLKERLVGGAEERLLVLLGTVALVLLIACVNVANLLLARATARQREIALRASLGAGRQRMIRQLLTESLVLSLGGAVLGGLGAWWGVRLLNRATTPLVPGLNPVSIDITVLLFTLGISVFAALLFGLAPALQLSRSQVSDSLKAAGQAMVGPSLVRQRLRDALIVSEIAITLALLVGAGLLLRSFIKLQNAGIGVDPHNLLTASLNLPDAVYPGLAARRQFLDQLLERTRRIPGVEAAALSTEIPLEGHSNGYIQVEGVSDPAISSTLIGFNYVTPDYFKTFGIALARGRAFDAEDLDHDAAVCQKMYEAFLAAGHGPPQIPTGLTLHAIISKTAARTFWKSRDPLGGAFVMGPVKVIVIGIVDDVKEYGIRAKTMAQAYFPLTQALPYDEYANLTLKTAITPAAVLGDLRRNLYALDRGLALLRPRTMEELIGSDTQDARSETLLLGAFAALALVLAAVGLYGVMSYTVTQRTREIGIRMAVGAKRTDVLSMILRQGLWLTLAGVLAGLLLAGALSRSMAGLLFGVSPFDSFTFGCMAFLLALVATVAYTVPARRATTIDPMVALRYE
ncbi:MAG: ABC transporter permease [Acidobacteriaceae bacterium]|nr:ABC transporter permease [Acidobacteriaceae bacterium]MBV9295146.1 ABC transporter permease [Acidobacteriaceae bacterium]MBV9766631.1 ABC transporter permease [Acidobacteriaceae bacterium]